jgi:hypothetical protein
MARAAAAPAATRRFLKNSKRLRAQASAETANVDPIAQRHAGLVLSEFRPLRGVVKERGLAYDGAMRRQLNQVVANWLDRYLPVWKCSRHDAIAIQHLTGA